MLMSSRSAVSRHICSQPRRRRRSSKSRITPGCQDREQWVTEGAQQSACLQVLGHTASMHPPTQPPGHCSSPSCPHRLSCLTSAFPSLPTPHADPSRCRANPSSPCSPVLKPRPRAGHGLWFFQRLPKYQSLWFSTSPITCLSEEKEGHTCGPLRCKFVGPKQTHCTGAVTDEHHHHDGPEPQQVPQAPCPHQRTSQRQPRAQRCQWRR